MKNSGRVDRDTDGHAVRQVQQLLTESLPDTSFFDSVALNTLALTSLYPHLKCPLLLSIQQLQGLLTLWVLPMCTHKWQVL